MRRPSPLSSPNLRLKSEIFANAFAIFRVTHSRKIWWCLVEKAVVQGLITNELVTIAIKLVFADGRAGTIKVAFAQDDAGDFVLTVADDGIGCSDDAPVGFGTRLIEGLTVQHGGHSLRQDARLGGRVEVRIPGTAPSH
jgi:two-component sensor histidine kinase